MGPIDISKFVEWLRLPARVFVALGLASAILLFASVDVLDIFGLGSFVESYRPIIGAIFVVSLSISVVSAFIVVSNFIYPWIAQAYWIRHGRNRLNNLTPDEKEILAYYINNQTRSQSLPIQSGVVNGLEREKIIVRGSQLGNLYGFDYVMQPWAWEYLNENPSLLE